MYTVRQNIKPPIFSEKKLTTVANYVLEGIGGRPVSEKLRVVGVADGRASASHSWNGKETARAVSVHL